MSRVLRRLAWFTTASAVGGAGAWKYYTKDTEIRDLHTTPSSRAFSTLTTSLAALNPSSNPPSLADHAVRRVPLSRLRTTDVRTLAREFCAGVWAGPGFKVQRQMLERDGRALEGREDHLWEKGEFEGSGYEVGTRIADHFEVVDRGPNKIVVRCGDTPHNAGPRPSDGIFSMEVDKEDGYATFHMKTVFFNSTPEGATPAQLPWWLPFVHREYTKLWMETSVRRLMS